MVLDLCGAEADAFTLLPGQSTIEQVDFNRLQGKEAIMLFDCRVKGGSARILILTKESSK